MRSLSACKFNIKTAISMILLLLLFVFYPNSFCQESISGNTKQSDKYYEEQLLVRTDRDLYITGEKVWIKIYKINSLTQTPENLSKIVYLEAMDSDNNPLVQLKVRVDGYSGSVSFRLPDTLRTGNYFLRSYTNWMQNFSESHYTYKVFSVINPFKFNDLNKTSTFKTSDSVYLHNHRSPGQSVNYKIAIQKNEYYPREKIRLDISATDNKGNPLASDFSLSVTKAATIDPRLSNSISAGNGKDTVITPVFLPELEGHLITGSIRDRNTGDPVKNQNVTLSFVGKAALCHFSKTNDKGEFHINTSERGTREIVVEPLSDKISDYFVELDNPFSPAIIKFKPGTIYIDTSRLDQINNIIISAQINYLYEPYIQEISKNVHPKKEPDFYGKPDNTIFLSDYIELTSLKEVVKEIIPGVNNIRKDGKADFKLFYPNQSKPYENDPLVLVDGVPVYNLEKVLAINSKDLEKIDVFTTRYYKSDIIMDGILHFVTKKGDLGVIEMDRSAYRVEYEFPVDPVDFYSPDYSSDEKVKSHIPDFRNTLFWNPRIYTDNTGKACAEFYSSDESGEYIITIEGMTADGQSGSAHASLNIKGK